MSKLTLQQGVESMMKHYCPEVKQIISEDDPDAKKQGYTLTHPNNKTPPYQRYSGDKG